MNKNILTTTAFLFSILFCSMALGSPGLKKPLSKPIYSYPADKNLTCFIKDIPTLKSCFSASSLALYSHFVFENSISCQGQNCCNGAGALISLSSVSNKTIIGNHHRLTRNPAPAVCEAIRIQQSSNISVRGLDIDEGSGVLCGPNDSCRNTVSIVESQNIQLTNFSLYNAKASAIVVRAVNNFLFQNGVISVAGISGITLNTDTTNALIDNSIFSKIRTNALVTIGVASVNSTPSIRVSNNVFNKNHWNGLWKTLDENGNEIVVNGGQLLLRSGRGIEIKDNIIADGYCDNCAVGIDDSVWGIELGYPLLPLETVRVSGNYFYNSLGAALFQSKDARLIDFYASGNTVRGLDRFTFSWNDYSDLITGVNSIGDATPSLNYRGKNNYRIYQFFKNGVHKEASQIEELPGWSIMRTVQLSSSPVVGASPNPLYRCLNKSLLSDDYISKTPCEGHILHSIVGYSYPVNEVGAIPVYRCLSNGSTNHFIHYSATCGGHISQGLLGYMKPI